MATVEAPTRPQTRLHEGPFVNEPLTDFTKELIARQMRAAIEKCAASWAGEYDLIIGGKRTRTSDKINPSIQPSPRNWSDCTRRPAKSTWIPPCRQRSQPLPVGAGRLLKSGPACSSAWET